MTRAKRRSRRRARRRLQWLVGILTALACLGAAAFLLFNDALPAADANRAGAAAAFGAVAASTDNSAWIEDGVARILGDNTHGQRDTADWPQVIMVRLGDAHAVGLTADGDVVFAGSDEQGQCDLDAGGARVVSIEAGPYATYAVLADGTVRACGETVASPAELASEHGVVAVSAGAAHVAVLHADGTLKAYGENLFGECDTEGWTDIVMADCGFGLTVALDGCGRVFCAGDPSKLPRQEITGARAVAAGTNNVYVIMEDGSVVTSGYNGGGQLDAALWKNVAAIAGGYMHVVGVDEDGGRLGLGSNASGQLG